VRRFGAAVPPSGTEHFRTREKKNGREMEIHLIWAKVGKSGWVDTQQLKGTQKKKKNDGEKLGECVHGRSMTDGWFAEVTCC
jgi:hypothetical protein